MAEVEKKVLLKENIAPSISQEHKEEPKEPEPEVLTAKPIARAKKSTWSKLAETFIKEDLKNVGAYIVQDVLIPSIGDTLCTMVQESAERVFHGGGGYSDKKSGPSGYTSYNSLYNKRKSGPIRVADKDSSKASEFLDPVYQYRDEAERKLNQIWEWVGAYHQISLAKVKQMTGDSHVEWVDRDWGFIEDQMDEITIRKVREGYRIFFPEPSYIKD